MLDLEVIMMALHGEYWTCSCMNTVFSQLFKMPGLRSQI